MMTKVLYWWLAWKLRKKIKANQALPDRTPKGQAVTYTTYFFGQLFDIVTERELAELMTAYRNVTVDYDTMVARVW